jgi:SAM-dependent methyltransferase
MYDSDLSYIQHHGFSDFARAAGPGVLRILRSAGITSGHVLDLGCGDGTWLRTLGENGFSATGIDQSASLIEYSAKNAPAATLRVGSVFKVSLPRCDAITALGEVFSYRSGPGGSPHSFRGLFKRAYAALRPGGVLIFDVFVKGRRMKYKTWRVGATWAVLAHVNEEPVRRRLTRDIVTFRKAGQGYRRRAERHVLTVSTPSAVTAELRRAGFSVRSTRAYGGFRLPYRRLGFVARKPVAG